MLSTDVFFSMDKYYRSEPLLAIGIQRITRVTLLYNIYPFINIYIWTGVKIPSRQLVWSPQKSAQTHGISPFTLRLRHGSTMDLAFGATEASVAPPVGVVSDRSNGFCCGMLGCFETAAQTHKMAICCFNFSDRQ
jgi:hypothetical protein